jgi:hypothetical protein
MPFIAALDLETTLRWLRRDCGLDRDEALIAACDFLYWRVGEYPWARSAFVEAQIAWEKQS